MSKVVEWWYGNSFRRLFASIPLSMAGRENGSDTWSKPGELRGRGVAQKSVSGDVGNYSTR